MVVEVGSQRRVVGLLRAPNSGEDSFGRRAVEAGRRNGSGNPGPGRVERTRALGGGELGLPVTTCE